MPRSSNRCNFLAVFSSPQHPSSPFLTSGPLPTAKIHSFGHSLPGPLALPTNAAFAGSSGGFGEIPALLSPHSPAPPLQQRFSGVYRGAVLNGCCCSPPPQADGAGSSSSSITTTNFSLPDSFALPLTAMNSKSASPSSISTNPGAAPKRRRKAPSLKESDLPRQYLLGSPPPLSLPPPLPAPNPSPTANNGSGGSGGRAQAPYAVSIGGAGAGPTTGTGAGGGGGGGGGGGATTAFRNVSACNRCRKRKNRCDQRLPACQSCEKAVCTIILLLVNPITFIFGFRFSISNPRFSIFDFSIFGSRFSIFDFRSPVCYFQFFAFRFYSFCHFRPKNLLLSTSLV